QADSNDGGFPMWFLSTRKARRPARSSSFRPRLEALEDRCLLSAGALDPTFNPAGHPPGTATVPLSGAQEAQEFATGVLVQPSGKVAITGDSVSAKGQHVFSAACFTPDGTPDTTFGSGGKVITSFKGNSTAAFSGGAALYPTGQPGDEKILEVGW